MAAVLGCVLLTCGCAGKGAGSAAAPAGDPSGTQAPAPAATTADTPTPRPANPGVQGAGSKPGPHDGAGQATAPGATSTAARQRPVAPAHPVPAAFRPAPGAPSDEEVRMELEKMAAVQRRQREQALSAAAANLAGLLPWTLEQKSGIQVSVASVFTDYGLGLACGGVLGRYQLGVAHKTAPCGTMITFAYGGRSITVPVIDRGPYIAGREWDLTGATAEALGFPGLGRIAWSLAH